MKSLFILAHTTTEPHSHAEFWLASAALLLAALTIRRILAARR